MQPPSTRGARDPVGPAPIDDYTEQPYEDEAPYRETYDDGYYGRSLDDAYYDDRYRRTAGRSFGRPSRPSAATGLRAYYEDRYGARQGGGVEDFDLNEGGAARYGEDRRRRDRPEQEAPFRGVGPRGYARSDDAIETDVNDALTDDGYVDATHMRVTVDGGEVTLEGFAQDRAGKRRADALAHRVRGVRDVHNRLRIDYEGEHYGT